MQQKVNIFWFRRDLRLHDNHALYLALKSELPVVPIFIFDDTILSELPKNDARVSFIYESLRKLNEKIQEKGGSLKILKGKPLEIWKTIINEFQVEKVFFNKDYEPYAIKRDYEVKELLQKNAIDVFSVKDQVIFEENEVVKNDGKPYTVYTPYKKSWLAKYKDIDKTFYSSETIDNFLNSTFEFPSLSSIGFEKSNQEVLPFNESCVKNYEKFRDLPYIETSNLSVFLRFGTVSIRKLVVYATKHNDTFLSELIWREFFMQILFHFPQVVHQNFKPKYNSIQWLNNKDDFEKWCEGKTGYPIVDAGMRQLNKTGYMHNRVRMIVASFLTKHLMIDWRWGEAYFAEKLLDYELSSNNGNWQWVAGTGCDAAPYFRVFNPISQQEKFDPNFTYIKKWNPNYTQKAPIIEHKYARERYLEMMKKCLPSS